MENLFLFDHPGLENRYSIQQQKKYSNNSQYNKSYLIHTHIHRIISCTNVEISTATFQCGKHIQHRVFIIFITIVL